VQAFVIWKSVPDTVEELPVRGDGGSLDRETLRFTLGDADEHALEQALLLKERHGGKVHLVTLDAPEIDHAIYTALAKGADTAVKIAIDQTVLGTAAIARVVASFLTATPGRMTADTLLLPGSQAIDDLEGELGAFLSEAVALPYLGVVCGVTLVGGQVLATKEFAGGVRGEFEVPLPAVLGIQSAERPPRYVPVAKVRAVMKSARIDSVELPVPSPAAALPVTRMYKPPATGRAQMIDGSAGDIAVRLADILHERNLI